MTDQKKLTATQRIEGLERALVELSEKHNHNTRVLSSNIDELKKQNGQLSEEVHVQKQTMRALAKRLNATIQAGEKGQLNSELIDELLIEEGVKDLQNQVNQLLKLGALEEAKSPEISERSFVVGRELDEEKNVINTRIQFAVPSIVPEAQATVLGKKVGDNVLNPDGTTLEILEVYDIAEKIQQNLEQEHA